MRNKKGFLVFGLTAVPFLFMSVAIVIGGICIKNIPLWTKAKAHHCEALFQAGDYHCGER